MRSATVWGLMCLLVSGGFFYSAASIYFRRRRFLSRAVPATGKVVEVQIEGIGRNAMSVPIFEFTTSDGKAQRARSMMGSGFQRFEEGQQIPIRYDPGDPSIAEVDTLATLWGVALLRTGFGVVFMLMGLTAIVMAAVR